MTNKRFSFILILVFLISMLAACQQTPTVAPTLVPEPTPVKPEAGKAAFTGTLLKENGEPHSLMTLRLGQIFRGADGEAAFMVDEASSPSTIAAQDGSFVFQNLEPGEYVLVVGSMTVKYEVISEDDSPDAKIFTAVADQVVSLGTIASVVP